MTSQELSRGLKLCTFCRERKPADQFRPDRRLSSGLSSWCISCHVAAVRRWREAHSGYVAAFNERRRRRPIPERPCAVCGEPFTPIRRDGRFCSAACRERRRAVA